ncbi:MAG: hypothetical protein M0R33_17145 [Methylomonas sp.]|jgi:hypothetical protein|uniref:hypothetical protein n=1 Tax=Methylomonas sp. TaxID=418 RepID=UPI0025D3956E|nr:hypothetical protein [Methylomonas sp.]MCK9608173.1 hypothetical protein [Methylomonas sp.]
MAVLPPTLIVSIPQRYKQTYTIPDAADDSPSAQKLSTAYSKADIVANFVKEYMDDKTRCCGGDLFYIRFLFEQNAKTIPAIDEFGESPLTREIMAKGFDFTVIATIFRQNEDEATTLSSACISQLQSMTPGRHKRFNVNIDPLPQQIYISEFVGKRFTRETQIFFF